MFLLFTLTQNLHLKSHCDHLLIYFKRVPSGVLIMIELFLEY